MTQVTLKSGLKAFGLAAIVSVAITAYGQGIWGPLVGTVTAMFLLIYSLSSIGDALRDVLDPRTA